MNYCRCCSFGATVSRTSILTILSQWFSSAFVVIDSSQWSSFAIEEGYAGSGFLEVGLKVHFQSSNR